MDRPDIAVESAHAARRSSSDLKGKATRSLGASIRNRLRRIQLA